MGYENQVDRTEEARKEDDEYDAGPPTWMHMLGSKAIRHFLIILAFGCIFYALEHYSPETRHFSQKLEGIDAWYFAMVCQSTAGFGDIAPSTQTAKILVMLQLGLILSNLFLLH